MNLQLDILLEGEAFEEEAALRARIVRALSISVKTAGLDLPDDAELSLLLTGDERIRHLNRDWRQKDRPTNVLSFPGPGKPGTQPVLGDIAISLETLAREADLEGKSVDAHFTHLLVHGFLHLFGYDHEADEDAGVMENLETAIMRQLGFEDPYQ